MSPVTLGLVCGLVFGLVAAGVVSQVPVEGDKTMVMLAAFVNRFSIGFLIPVTSLGMSKPLSGLLLGLLISIPPAIFQNKFMWPILIGGPLGGLVIGWIASRTKK